MGRQKNIIALRRYCRKCSEGIRSLGDNALSSRQSEADLVKPGEVRCWVEVGEAYG